MRRSETDNKGAIKTPSRDLSHTIHRLNDQESNDPRLCIQTLLAQQEPNGTTLAVKI